MMKQFRQIIRHQSFSSFYLLHLSWIRKIAMPSFQNANLWSTPSILMHLQRNISGITLSIRIIQYSPSLSVLREETSLGLELRPVYSPGDPDERLPEYLENKLLLRSLSRLSLDLDTVLLHLRPRSMQQVWSVQEIWPPALVILLTSDADGQ